MSPVWSPAWHGNRVTQRVTHPSHPAPGMRHCACSRLTQTPQKQIESVFVCAHAVSPTLSSGPCCSPQPRSNPLPAAPVALAQCMWQLGTLSHSSPAQTPGHVTPQRHCCQNGGSAAPKRWKENLAGDRGWGAAATSPGDRVMGPAAAHILVVRSEHQMDG